MKAFLRRLATALFTLGIIVLPLNIRLRATAPTIGISGTHFTIDSSNKFLVFVSYFDAWDADDKRDSDFDQLRSLGVDGIRIFPNWWTRTTRNAETGDTYAGDTLIDGSGDIREGVYDTLEDIIESAGNYGLVVDIAFSAETVGTADETPAGNCSNQQLSVTEAVSALGDIADRLSGYTNIIIDVQNEWTKNRINDSGCTYLTPTDITAMVGAVTAHGIYATASAESTGNYNYTASDAGTSSYNTVQDFVAYHEPRETNKWLHYGDMVDDAHSSSGDKPVFFDEPGKISSSEFPDAATMISGYGEAESSGAAAWCFHTPAGHYMNGGYDWFSNLSDDEKEFISTFRTPDPIVINLETVNHYFAGFSGSDGTAYASSAGNNETITVQNRSNSCHCGAVLDGDSVAFLLYGGTNYYQAEDGGGTSKVLLANASSVGSWETFKVSSLSSRCDGIVGSAGSGDCQAVILRYDPVSLKTANDKFVGAESGGNDIINASAGSVGSWETFNWWWQHWY